MHSGIHVTFPNDELAPLIIRCAGGAFLCRHMSGAIIRRRLSPAMDTSHSVAPVISALHQRGFLGAHRAARSLICPITFHDSERNVRYIMRAGRNGPASCFFLLRDSRAGLSLETHSGGLSRGRAPGRTLAAVLD